MSTFEGVHEAIDAKYGNQASDQPENAPTSESSPETKEVKENNQAAEAIIDLTKVGKFKIDGQDYTWDQLKNERHMYSEFMRKTQELANERRSFEEQKTLNEHFKADLPKVLQNPQLINEVEKHYPKEFVEMFKSFLDMSPRQQQQAMEQGMQLDPRTIQKYVEPIIKPIQEKIDRYETDILTKQMDAIYSKMKTKYPSASEEFVTARLGLMNDQKIPITEGKIEEVFKALHELDVQAKDAYHKEQLKKQSEATAKGKDAPSGGSTPGLAPKRLKLDEVKGAFMDHMRRQQQ